MTPENQHSLRYDDYDCDYGYTYDLCDSDYD